MPTYRICPKVARRIQVRVQGGWKLYADCIDSTTAKVRLQALLSTAFTQKKQKSNDIILK
jgi:hypothetical protein